LQIAEHIAPLVLPSGDDASAARFDQLIYQIELAMLTEKTYKRAKNDVIRKADELFKNGTIPAIAQQKDLLEQIRHNEYLERAGIADYENIRVKLRDLIKVIPENERTRFDTDFTDDILSIDWKESQLDNDDLVNYKKKVNYYILQHQSIPAIAKLKGNQPLTSEDVRSIVGFDQKAANEAFSRFLNDAELDSRQRHLVRQIVNFIFKNGMMKDLSVLQESPFTDQGSISELFDDVAVFRDLRVVIERINRNAVAA